MEKPSRGLKRPQEKSKHRQDKASQDAHGSGKVVTTAMDSTAPADMEQGLDTSSKGHHHDAKHGASKERKGFGVAFLICFWGIFCSYFVYGLLQERMYVCTITAIHSFLNSITIAALTHTCIFAHFHQIVLSKVLAENAFITSFSW